MSQVTTHVLDLATGRPAAGIAVVLERIGGGTPGADRLGDDRRHRPRRDARSRALAAGVYQLRFDVGGYQGGRGFFPEVTISFRVAEQGAEHYHVPLLLSPGATRRIAAAEVRRDLAVLASLPEPGAAAARGRDRLGHRRLLRRSRAADRARGADLHPRQVRRARQVDGRLGEPAAARRRPRRLRACASAGPRWCTASMSTRGSSTATSRSRRRSRRRATTSPPTPTPRVGSSCCRARSSARTRSTGSPSPAPGACGCSGLHIFPDGGVARLRVYGEARRSGGEPGGGRARRSARRRERRLGRRRERRAFRRGGEAPPPRARRSTWATAGRRAAGAAPDSTGRSSPSGQAGASSACSSTRRTSRGTSPTRRRSRERSWRAPGENLVAESASWPELLPKQLLRADAEHHYERELARARSDLAPAAEHLSGRRRQPTAAFGTAGCKTRDRARRLLPIEPLTPASVRAVRRSDRHGGNRARRRSTPARRRSSPHLARVEVVGDGASARRCRRGSGRDASASTARSRARLPLPLLELERHPLGSQAFVPLAPTRYLVVVAGAADEPSPADVRVFLARRPAGRQPPRRRLAPRAAGSRSRVGVPGGGAGDRRRGNLDALTTDSWRIWIGD